MDLCSGILCTIVFVIFLLHCLFEVHYFLRMCLVLINARLMKKRAHILDQTEVKGELLIMREHCAIRCFYDYIS